MFRILVTLALTCYACTTQEAPKLKTQEIAGRDAAGLSGEIKRHPLYRANVPETWKRIDPSANESTYNTMLPICEYRIEDSKKGSIHITIHNFPSNEIAERTPPQSQVFRWRKQFDLLQPENAATTLCAHGGFAGFCFEGTGILKGKETTVLAWTMQLAVEHYHNLMLTGTVEEELYFQQMRADTTIKAVGSPGAIEKYHDEITSFARSFELIREIPSNS
jgi:hypothetical protein